MCRCLQLLFAAADSLLASGLHHVNDKAVRLLGDRQLSGFTIVSPEGIANMKLHTWIKAHWNKSRQRADQGYCDYLEFWRAYYNG